MASATAKPLIRCFMEEKTSTAQYVISCPQTKKAAIIDSVLNVDLQNGKATTESADEILEYVSHEGLTVTHVLETHIHSDHVTAAQYLKRKLTSGDEAPVYAITEKVTLLQKEFGAKYELDFKGDGSQFDQLIEPNATFQVGKLLFKAIPTPGHTPGCLSFLVDEKVVFVGDTFFPPDSGTARCDFPYGSAGEMWESLQRILALPDDVQVYVCHDYRAGGDREEYNCNASVAEQRYNKQIVGKTEEEYKEFRHERDEGLGNPKLLHAALQYNLQAGHPPSSGFIKMPMENGWYKS